MDNDLRGLVQDTLILEIIVALVLYQLHTITQPYRKIVLLRNIQVIELQKLALNMHYLKWATALLYCSLKLVRCFGKK